MVVSFRRRALITLLVELCCAPAAAAQTTAPETTGAQTTLIQGTVRAPIEADDKTAAWFGGHPVTIQRADTGQQWQTATSALWGIFEFQGLPPGRYRLYVPGIDGRIVWSGERLALRGYRSGEFVLQEGRPLTFDIVLAWIDADSPLASTPLTGRAMPMLPLVETCQTGRLPGMPSGHEVWGAARLPDGRPAAGIPVHIERISDGAGLTADHIDVQTRTSSTGCFGLAGLWPGRYRVYVDHAPFTVDAEVDLRETSVASHDIMLSAPPEDSRPQRLRSAWYPRLGIQAGTISALLDAVAKAETAQQRASARRDAAERDTAGRDAAEREAAARDVGGRDAAGREAAGSSGTIDPDDMVRVGGAVIWRYDPIEWREHYRVPDVRVIFEREDASSGRGSGRGSGSGGSSGTGQRWEATTTGEGAYEVYVPQGRYRVRIEHPPFMPVSARVLALPEGFAVLDGFKTPQSSGLYPPRAARRTGLMAALNIGLVLPVDERTQVEMLSRDTPAVVNASASENAPVSGAPLAITFDQADLDRPLTSGRTVQALLGAVPGVVITESVGTLAQVSAIGQRRFANRLTVDGVSGDLAVNLNTPALDEAASGTLPAQATSGGTQTLVPFAAVDEITIRTANTSPEFAQTPGAQTAIVTRAGADRRSGLALFEARPRGLAASDYFPTLSGQPRRFSARNGAASLGGPLWRGRLFYFGAVEGQQIDRPYAATVSIPSASLREDESVPQAIRSILDAFPMPNGHEPGLGIDTGPDSGDGSGSDDGPGDGLAEFSHAFPISSSLAVISMRTDANIGMRHRLFGRINVGKSRGDAVRPPDQRPDFSFRQLESTHTGTATFGLSSAFAATAANDLRVNVSGHHGWQEAGPAEHGGAAELDLSFVAPGAIDPRVRLTTLPTPNTSGVIASGRTSDASQRQFQFTDTFTAVRGRHELRMGIDITRVEASTPAFTRYTYNFGSVEALREGKARLIFEERAEARAIFRSFATFAQDTWRLSPRLTLQYGVRYSVTPAPVSGNELAPALVEFESLPIATKREPGEPLWHTSWQDIAPHVSAIYLLDAREGRQTTLRAGWDLVFDEVSSPGASAFGDGPPYISRRNINPTVVPVSLDTLHNMPAAPAAEQYAFDKELKRPRTYRWHVGLDRELGRANRLDLVYVGSAARQLVYRAGYRPPLVNVLTHTFSNESSADYHGLFAQYTRRITRVFDGGLSYTWSHAIDTDSGESQFVNLPTAMSPIRNNRASADYDRRHVLRVSGSFELPAPHWLRLARSPLGGWRLDVIGMMKSGAPVTVVRSAVGTGSYFVRPDLIDGVPLWIDEPSSPTGRRINPEAFRTPSWVGHGTLGRNTFWGTPLRQIDVALLRSFRLGAAAAQMSVEAFNLFNLTNFGPPYPRDDPQFGMPIASAADDLGSGTLSRGGLVALQQFGGPRSFKLRLRLSW